MELANETQIRSKGSSQASLSASLTTDYFLQKKSLTYFRRLFKRLIAGAQVSQIQKTVLRDLKTVKIARKHLHSQSRQVGVDPKRLETAQFKDKYVSYFGSFLNSILGDIRSEKAKSQSRISGQQKKKKQTIPRRKEASIASKKTSQKSKSIYEREKVISNVRSVHSKKTGSRSEQSKRESPSQSHDRHVALSINSTSRVSRGHKRANPSWQTLLQVRNRICFLVQSFGKITKAQIDKYNKFLQVCRPRIKTHFGRLGGEDTLERIRAQVSAQLGRRFLGKLFGESSRDSARDTAPVGNRSLHSAESESETRARTRNKSSRDTPSQIQLSIFSRDQPKISNESQNHSLSSEETGNSGEKESTSCPQLESSSGNQFRIRQGADNDSLRKRAANMNQYTRRHRQSRLERVNCFEKIGAIIQKEIEHHMSVLHARVPQPVNLGDSGFGSQVEESMKRIRQIEQRETAQPGRTLSGQKCRGRQREAGEKKRQACISEDFAQSVYKEDLVHSRRFQTEMGSMASSVDRDKSEATGSARVLSLFSQNDESNEESRTRAQGLQRIAKKEAERKPKRGASINISVKEMQFQSQKMLHGHTKKISVDLEEMLEIISPPNLQKEDVKQNHADQAKELKNNSDVVNCDRVSGLDLEQVYPPKRMSSSRVSAKSLFSEDLLSINSESKRESSELSESVGNKLSLFGDEDLLSDASSDVDGSNEGGERRERRERKGQSREPGKCSEKEKSWFENEMIGSIPSRVEIKKKDLINQKRVSEGPNKENLDISNLMTDSGQDQFSRELTRSLMRMEKQQNGMINSRYRFEDEAEKQIQELIHEIRIKKPRFRSE